MAQSPKMTGVTGKPSGIFIPDDVYLFLNSILDEGVPGYEEPIAEHIRHAVLAEIKAKVDHAYHKTR